MTSGALVDDAARARIRREHDTTFIVEAAAGTGKTTVLTYRVVEMVAVGAAHMREIAAITFTEKAAGELRLRVRQGIEDRIDGAAPDERRRLEKALHHLEEAVIGTIHAFAGGILRERPIEAGVDPDFEILSQADQALLFGRVFDEFAREALEVPGPGIARLLRRSRNPRQSPLDVLREAGRKLLDYRQYDAPWTLGKWDAAAATEELLGPDPPEIVRPGAEAPTRGPTLFEIERLYGAFPPDPPGGKPNWLRYSMQEAAALAREIRARRATGDTDPEWLEQALAALKVASYHGACPAGLPGAKDWRESFRVALEQYKKHSNAGLAALLREDLRGLVAQYQQAKQKAGKLDFDDLLLRTQRLLVQNAEVRNELRDRYRHILLDEYQDTDPLQTDIARILTSEDPPDGDQESAQLIPGRLFLVGDPKQSIYRFRRADIGHYLQVKETLLEQGAEELQLTTNFRSVPGVCELVNNTMEPLFTGTPVELDRYDEIPEITQDLKGTQAPWAPLHPDRKPMGDHPGIAGIEVESARYVRQLKGEPKAVARFVAQLLAEGFPVSDGDGKRPVRPDDICLLFRRFRVWGKLNAQRWADALRELQIPHSLAAVESYVASPEISFLRAALTAVEFPDDEVAVYATLRGPLFGIPDEDLFLYRERRRGEPNLRPGWAARAERPEGMPAIEREILAALQFLDRLHRQRNHRPITLTIQDLLGEHRAESGFAFWRSSDQVFANLRRLAESARAFEAGGGLSFREFVERLTAEAETPDPAAAHTIDDEIGGVRMMTVHAAKGLEFPVVILCDGSFARNARGSRVVRPEENLHACDLGSGLVPWELIHHQATEIAEELAEYDRLLYVAMTRARDLLAAPASPFGYPKASFLSPVAERLGALLLDAPPASAPRPAPVGRADLWNLLNTKDDAEAAAEGRAREAEFVKESERTLEDGRTPRRLIARAGRLGDAGLEAGPVEIEAIAREPDRPKGEAFGILVHRILETVPLDAAPEAVMEAAARAAVELGAAEALVGPAGRAAAAALQSPLMRAARAAPVLHRELPLLHQEESVRLPESETSEADSELERASEPEESEGDGPVVVDGVADLVFQEEPGGPWTVVDFKTSDPAITQQGDAYRVQVTLYARAVERATGEPARAVLLFV